MLSYFSLFELPESFELDVAELEKRYFAVQRTCHPDRLVGKSAMERQQAIARSMQANEAFDTLKSPLLRARHLLTLQGIHVGGEKDTVKPSGALLMEVMQWRETMEELDTAEALSTFRQQMTQEQEHLLAKLVGHFEAKQYDMAAEETLRLSYLNKLIESLHARVRAVGAREG